MRESERVPVCVCVGERERKRERGETERAKKFAIYCRSTLHWRFNEPTLSSFRVVHYQPEKECEKKFWLVGKKSLTYREKQLV